MLSKLASCSLYPRSIVSAERIFSSRWLSGVRLRSALRRASLAGFAGKGFYRFCFYPSLEAEFFVQGGARSARCGVAAEKPFRPHSLGISSPCGAPRAGSRTGFSHSCKSSKVTPLSPRQSWRLTQASRPASVLKSGVSGTSIRLAPNALK